MKASVAIFSMKGKANLQWEDLKNVKGIGGKELFRRRFERYFWENYLFERYYNNKSKELYEKNLR